MATIQIEWATSSPCFLCALSIHVRSFTSLVIGRASITQAESSGNDSVFLLLLRFSLIFSGEKPSSSLSFSTDTPYVTIKHGYLGTCNHIPRETAAGTVSRPVAAVESNGSCLHNCSEEGVLDQQRLKNGEVFDQ